MFPFLEVFISGSERGEGRISFPKMYFFTLLGIERQTNSFLRNKERIAEFFCNL